MCCWCVDTRQLPYWATRAQRSSRRNGILIHLMPLKLVHNLTFFSDPKNKTKLTKIQSILDQQAQISVAQRLHSFPRERGRCKCDENSVEANKMPSKNFPPQNKLAHIYPTPIWLPWASRQTR